MPALRGRERVEARLARALAKDGGQIARELLDLLGDPPQLANITSETWQTIADRYSGALSPVMEQVFVDAAGQMMRGTGFGMDWGLVNQAAADWSRQYTYNLVRGINATNQQLLQSAVNDFFNTSMTNADLRARLLRAYGPVRAEMIATTEVTRAAVEGEREIVNELGRQGALMKAIHQTAHDERVCPICGPRHGQEITDGRYPPLHPRCRCFVIYEPVEAAKFWLIISTSRLLA